MSVTSLIDRLRDEIPIIAHIELRELTKRLGFVVPFAALCFWLGFPIYALSLIAILAVIETAMFPVYRGTLARPPRISPRLQPLILAMPLLNTPLYLSPTLILASSGNAAVVLVGLLWLFGVAVHITNSFARTPVYGTMILIPTAVVAVVAVWIVANSQIAPAGPWDFWLVLAALLAYAYNNYITLARQTDTAAALATARSEADARLRQLEAAMVAHTEAEKRFDDIAAVSQDWFWEVDPDLRIRYLGHSFRASTGIQPEWFLGRSLAELGMRPGGAFDGDWEALHRLIAARQPVSGFVISFLDRRRGRRRQRVWLRLTGTPHTDARGAFAGYRGVCSNVTPYLAATERAEAANRAKSEFLAVMSHELRTPLTAVLGMAELLAARTRDPDSTAMIDTIRSSGQGLLSLLNDVLDLAKIEAGKMTVELVPYDPHDLARRSAALFRPRAELAGLALGVVVDPEVQGLRIGDPNRILQVLNNLIGNAVKFTQHGGVRVRIAADGPGALVLTVEDDGIGMDTQQQLRVFEQFEQAESSTSRRFGGTGLGLPITRQLVDLMGGTLTLDSAPGQGSRFTIRLPAPPTAAGASAGPPAPEPVAGGRRPQDLDLSGLKVLVADDNATNRRILDAMLSGLGLRPTLAHDGRAAVAAYAEGAFDLLLLDIAMPELDGIAALAEIRRRDAAQGRTGPPALAVTAHAMRHQIDEFLAAGFAGHVAKPFSRASLADAIAAVVEGGSAAGPPPDDPTRARAPTPEAA